MVSFINNNVNGIIVNMICKVKKLDVDALLPVYAHSGDAGMDLFALEDTTIPIGQIVAVRTGIAMQIPDGYVGLIWDKSGLSIRHGLKTVGGVIDSGFRGEILIGMTNLGKVDYVIEKGNKIAQMLIQPVNRVELVETEELEESVRGEGGFGSTGK
jgi:dUTP pyrophosphatase